MGIVAQLAAWVVALIFALVVIVFTSPDTPRFWPAVVNVTTRYNSPPQVQIVNETPVSHKGSMFTGFGCDVSPCYEKPQNPKAATLKKGDTCTIMTRGVASLRLVGYGWSMAKVQYSTMNDTSVDEFFENECPSDAEFWIPWGYYNMSATLR